jgi:hypothetical protein
MKAPTYSLTAQIAFRTRIVICVLAILVFQGVLSAQDPPALNPFGARPSVSSDPQDDPPALNPFAPVLTQREDSEPGYLELSDGRIVAGQIFMTRDKRLQIYDDELKRQREIPLRVVKSVECDVLWERIEREWRFRELASNEKYYTGRFYPAREYEHTITLNDERTITGPLAEIIYVSPLPEEGESPLRPGDVAQERFIIHKRDKGEWGDTLEELVYVVGFYLGEEALEEGRKKATEREKRSPDAPSE